MILMCDLNVAKTCLCTFQHAPVILQCINTSCVEAVALIRHVFLCLVAKMSDQF